MPDSLKRPLALVDDLVQNPSTRVQIRVRDPVCVTRFLVITKTKEPVIEEHVAEVKPEKVARTLAGAERVWQPEFPMASAVTARIAWS
jgi:hypothetical protein